MHVSDILREKGSKVVTARPGELIMTLAQRLRQEHIGAMVVQDKDGKILGIISERDIAHAVASHGADVPRLHVSDLMTSSVVSCRPGDTLGEVARVMTHRRIRHLPVVDGGKLAGIVSVGDVVKHRMDELQMEANVLRDYAIARN